MGPKNRPVRAGAIWGGLLGLVPAFPIALTLGIFSTANIRAPSILKTILAIGSSILVGGLIVLGGAIVGALIADVGRP